MTCVMILKNVACRYAKIENWNIRLRWKIKWEKNKKDAAKILPWLTLFALFPRYITQNPGPFGGCAGIPRLFMRQACSSSRWAAFLSSCFENVQRRSAAALARGHILGCTLFLKKNRNHAKLFPSFSQKKLIEINFLTQRGERWKPPCRYLFTYFLLNFCTRLGGKVRTIYLSTNSPHMHASPPSIKWDEFTVLLNAKGSHA